MAASSDASFWTECGEAAELQWPGPGSDSELGTLGPVEPLSKYAGKVTLVVNVASLCGVTKQHYLELNELADKYADQDFQILAFPCNQFGHQECASEAEIPAILKHARPGEGFVPRFKVFNKVAVNGPDAHPAFKFLKEHATDEIEAEDIGWYDAGVPRSALHPATGTDIQWNFQRFLVSADGKVLFRPNRKSNPLSDVSKIDAALGK